MAKYTLLFILFMGGILHANAYRVVHPHPCDTCTSNHTLNSDTGAVIPVRDPTFVLSHAYYKDHFGANVLLDKITDNQGNGCESLYGTRNFRPILHGAAYRGGANNYFHRDGRRLNQNPLPEDGIRNLCQEGFSATVYLYRNNFGSVVPYDTCDCVNNSVNIMDYRQLDYFDDAHVYEMLRLVHKAIVDPNTGPVYLHCWNGWHASGFISAVILKQYCAFNSVDAVNYWDLGTDGVNKSPRYQTQRERIKQFRPFPEFAISDSLQSCYCPEMPTDIDSSQLHIDLDHLVTVPEAIPVGLTIQMSNVRFKPGSSIYKNLSAAQKDIKKVAKAMHLYSGIQLEIGGHTDKSGKTATNIVLSEQRAKKVYGQLIEAGVAADRLTWKGYGPYQPVASNKYKTTRAQNRRIEIKILSKGTEDHSKLIDETQLALPIENKPVSDHKAPELVKPTVSKTPDHLYKHPEAFRKGDLIPLKGLVFEPYKTTISDRNNSDLKWLLKALKKNAELKLEVGGYTDDSGDYEGNKIISRDRARSVCKYLIDNGISAHRISCKGYGPQHPRYSNKTKAGRIKNRRIEVKIL